MRLLLSIIATVLLLAGEFTSATPMAGPRQLSDGNLLKKQSQSKQRLRSETAKINTDDRAMQNSMFDEDRGQGLSELKTRLSKTFRTIRIHLNREMRKNMKMDKLFRQGIKPEDLAIQYGKKKRKFQKQYEQFYKWRSAWRLQKPYPLPGTVVARTPEKP